MSDVYNIITERMIATLESGVCPWQKPWKTSAADVLPSNYVSKKAYRGINAFILLCTPYACPYWVTFKQARELAEKQNPAPALTPEQEREAKIYTESLDDNGESPLPRPACMSHHPGGVRKGEKGFPVVFWKRLPKTDKATGKPVLNSKGKPEMVLFLRYYTVFNLEQCEGIKWEKPAASVVPFEPLAEAARIVAEMPDAPEIRHGGARACYAPALDLVQMPKQETFNGAPEYYNTLFHELTHATGHAKRLDRKGITEIAAFGSDTYSREELVAEMGAAFLSGHAGILHNTVANSAAYLAGWIKALKEDSKLIVIAAAQAQKAADFILGVKHETESSE